MSLFGYQNDVACWKVIWEKEHVFGWKLLVNARECILGAFWQGSMETVLEVVKKLRQVSLHHFF